MNIFGIIILCVVGFLIAGPLGVILALGFALFVFCCTLPFRVGMGPFSWGRLETYQERAERLRRRRGY